MTYQPITITLASTLERLFIPLLLAVYGLAALVPSDGLLDVCGASIPISPWLLFMLLFTAGLKTRLPSTTGDLSTEAGRVAIGIVCRFLPLVPALAAVACMRSMAVTTDLREIIAGIALVAAMPSANTSTAWTHRASGDLFLCVVLVLSTTLIAPAVVPWGISMIAPDAGPNGTAPTGPTLQDVGGAVVLWVVAPMVAGMVFARVSGTSRSASRSAAASVGSLIMILLLNYLNASRALPEVVRAGAFVPLAWSFALGLCLVGLSYAVAESVGRQARLGDPAVSAITFAAGMSNTGLAGTLAISLFPGRPLLLFPVVACTFLQHAAAVGFCRRKASADDATAG